MQRPVEMKNGVRKPVRPNYVDNICGLQGTYGYSADHWSRASWRREDSKVKLEGVKMEETMVPASINVQILKHP